MKPWTHSNPKEFLKLDLRAHTFLQDVPLYDVWQLDLPAGGAGRTVSDIISLASETEAGPVVKMLFSFRWFLGRLFGWDKDSDDKNDLFEHRLNNSDRTQSSIVPGKKFGPFTMLYVFENEALSEIKNKTVHAALVWTLHPQKIGYRLMWGIYVKPVGRITKFYMLLIKPFRLWLVYPPLLKRLYKKWHLTYQAK